MDLIFFLIFSFVLLLINVFQGYFIVYPFTVYVLVCHSKPIIESKSRKSTTKSRGMNYGSHAENVMEYSRLPDIWEQHDFVKTGAIVKLTLRKK